MVVCRTLFRHRFINYLRSGIALIDSTRLENGLYIGGAEVSPGKTSVTTNHVI